MRFPSDHKKISMIFYPHEILRRVCQSVPDDVFDSSHMHGFANIMKKMIRSHQGIGLAAPQLGVDARIILIRPDEYDEFFLINPEIISESKQKVLDTEGCLSLPNIYGTVIRSQKIHVKARNEYGDRVEIEADDLVARIIGHEIDHLNGILFIDKVITIDSGQKRLELLRTREATGV